jgi:adenylate cyclase
MQMVRRLAAIMAADVVGFSSLMGDDETGTLAALQTHRAQIFDPVVEKHGGRVVKLMGDGTLVEFSSAVQAVEAALEIQQANTKADGRIRLRIGVNLGDIVIDGDDIYGDGVNVAARLEALAEPGGICIAAIVKDGIGNQIANDFKDIGEQNLKGIKRPIRVLCWPAHSATRSTPLKPEKPSIAILPFENMSSDPDDEYFSHGIADDLATDLAKVSGLFVFARSATREYQARSVVSTVVAQELGVRYVLEGSVRRGGGKLRINVRLTDAENASQLWAERFDGDLEDIFDFQDKITEHIVTTLALTLTRVEQDRAFQKETGNLKAYDYVLQGNAFTDRATKDANTEALEAYSKALALDNNYAPAHAGIAWALVREANQEWTSDPQYSLSLALKHAKQAVALDSSMAKARMVLADVYCWKRQHSLAVTEGRKAVELDPSNADAHFALAFYLVVAGDPEEAAKEAKLALRYNPMFASCFYYETLGIAYYLMGQYVEAAAALEVGLGRFPDYDGIHQWLAATHAKLGQIENAQAHAQEYIKLKPGVSLRSLTERLPYKRDSDLKHLFEGLRTAGIPE